MNQINPNKLLHSKWTANEPKKKEKHFIVVELNRDDISKEVLSCTLQAVMTKNNYEITWQTLKNDDNWLFGWK